MKIGTLTNSVVQIKNECEKLFNLVEEFPTVEGRIIAIELKEKLDKLLKLHEEDPANVKDIGEMKVVIEANAIRLESVLAGKSKEARAKYDLRFFAKKLYDDMKALQYCVAKDKDLTELDRLLIVNEMKWILMFYMASRHILFELDTDDENRIRSIVNTMNKYLNKEVPA